MSKQRSIKFPIQLLAITIILSLALLVFLGVSLTIISEKTFYQKEFEKNAVYSDFGSITLPDTIAGQLISYFWDDSDGLPDIAQFNAKEKSHLLDVKQVIVGLRNTAFALAILLLLAVLAALIFHKRLFLENLSIMLIASGAVVLLLSFLLVFLAINFDWAFTSFHHLFFPQGNWQFPSDSMLIRLFPEQTFLDFFAAILIRASLIGLLMAITGVAPLILRKKYKQKSKY